MIWFDLIEIEWFSKIFGLEPPRSATGRWIGSSDGRCVQRAGTYNQRELLTRAY